MDFEVHRSFRKSSFIVVLAFVGDDCVEILPVVL